MGLTRKGWVQGSLTGSSIQTKYSRNAEGPDTVQWSKITFMTLCGENVLFITTFKHIVRKFYLLLSI
jgi:hypothetical protein